MNDYCPKVSVDTALLVVALSVPDQSRLLERLEDAHVPRSGEVTGRLGSLRATVYPGKAVVVGSLPRFVYGTNARALDPAGVRGGLSAISSSAGLSEAAVLGAAVRRVDVAANLLLAYPPAEYARALADVPRAARLQASPGSVVFRNTVREVAFYDKGAELAAKGRAVPEEWAGRHVLRYELRLKRQLSREFGRTVRAADLAEPAFHNGLVERWRDRYATVRTRRPLRLLRATGTRELRDALALRGVEAEGGPHAVRAAIDAARASGTVEAVPASRMRSCSGGSRPRPR